MTPAIGSGRCEPGLDGQGRDVGGLARTGLDLPAGVTLEHLGDVGRRRDRGPLAFGGRHEEADGPVAGGEVLVGDVLDLRRRDLLDPVAVEEIKSPVALGGPFAELDGDAVGIGGGQLAVLEDLLAGPIHFLLGDARSSDLLDDRDHDVAHLFERRTGPWC